MEATDSDQRLDGASSIGAGPQDASEEMRQLMERASCLVTRHGICDSQRTAGDSYETASMVFVQHRGRNHNVSGWSFISCSIHCLQRSDFVSCQCELLVRRRVHHVGYVACCRSPFCAWSKLSRTAEDCYGQSAGLTEKIVDIGSDADGDLRGW